MRSPGTRTRAASRATGLRNCSCFYLDLHSVRCPSPNGVARRRETRSGDGAWRCPMSRHGPRATLPCKCTGMLLTPPRTVKASGARGRRGCLTKRAIATSITAERELHTAEAFKGILQSLLSLRCR